MYLRLNNRSLPTIHWQEPGSDDVSFDPSLWFQVNAVVVSNFHWGLHSWTVYTMTGLALGFAFRKELPLTFRSALYPILGDCIYGSAGHGG